MKFVIDNEIPFVEGLFEKYGAVVYKNGSEISHEDIVDADCLIIRTRTRCNQALLEGTSVKMIAVSAIGTDHIDISWCNAHGIMVSKAAGSNAGAVADYVFSALYGCAARKSVDLSNATIGIIGAGNVGTRVELMARALGMKVLLCDPARQENEGSTQFSDLDTLLQSSDVVTMHVPLTEATRGMCNAAFFEKMRFGSFFINTARGELVVDQDLIDAVPKLGAIIIDAWNNEPDINIDLLEKVDIATPHISGYSLQGKVNSVAMAVRSVARFFQIQDLYEFFPTNEVPGFEAVRLDVTGMTQGQIASAFQYNYPIFTDDFLFRLDPGDFLRLRANYKYRMEFYLG